MADAASETDSVATGGVAGDVQQARPAAAASLQSQHSLNEQQPAQVPSGAMLYEPLRSRQASGMSWGPQLPSNESWAGVRHHSSGSAAQPTPAAEDCAVPDSEGIKPSWLELFFDLVFVVLVHNTAYPLESGPLQPDDIYQYTLRAFYTWWLWHQGARWANVMQRLYLFELVDVWGLRLWAGGVAVLMALLSLLAGAAKVGNNEYFLVYYVCARGVLAVCLIAQDCIIGRVAMLRGFTHDRRLALYHSGDMLVEFAALVPAAALAWYGYSRSSKIIMGAHALFWILLRVAVSVWPQIWMLADRIRTNHQRDMRRATSHFEERYSLLALILLGEVVLAGANAGAGSGRRAVKALAAIVTALGLFRFHYASRLPGWRGPHELSFGKGLQASLVRMTMLCSLAALGAAYSRVVASGEHTEDAGERASVAAVNKLVSCSAGVTVVCMTALDALGLPDLREHAARLSLRLLSSVMIGATGALPVDLISGGTAGEHSSEESGRAGDGLATCLAVPLVLCLMLLVDWLIGTGPQNEVEEALDDGMGRGEVEPILSAASD